MGSKEPYFTHQGCLPSEASRLTELPPLHSVSCLPCSGTVQFELKSYYVRVLAHSCGSIQYAAKLTMVWTPKKDLVYKSFPNLKKKKILSLDDVTIKIEVEMHKFLLEAQLFGKKVNVVLIIMILKTFIRTNGFLFFLQPPTPPSPLK